MTKENYNKLERIVEQYPHAGIVHGINFIFITSFDYSDVVSIYNEYTNHNPRMNEIWKDNNGIYQFRLHK